MHTPPTRRVAFYSHDTQGLGHIRRNITLAAALVAAEPDTDVLLITGNPEAAALPLPPRTDVATLPTIRKDRAGRYATRAMGSPLELVLDVRASIIDAALAAFEPDLLVVDKVPLGVRGELEPALRTLRAMGTTRIVLGLREVLDSAEVAIAEWAAGGTTEAVEAYFDAVWVYGDAAVYDLVHEYSLPASVADRVVHTGYLGHGRGIGTTIRGQVGGAGPADSPYVLCVVGGGQDGAELAEAFVRAPVPAGHSAVLVTGPYLPAARRTQLLDLAGPDTTVLGFVTDVDQLITGAAAVVSMAGYNSTCEVLAAGVPALFAPRETPRAEQLVRAQGLAGLGLVDLLRAGDLSPQAVGEWTAQAVRRPRPAGGGVDLDGLSRVPELVSELLAPVVHRAA